MSTTIDNQKIFDVSACIIAGGKGRRFGGDKLMHVYRGKPLILHVADILRKNFDTVSIIADDAARFAHLPFPCYADLVKNVGPLAGILTALHYSPSKRIFAAAGDMPVLSEQLIRYMVEISKDFDVTVPIVGEELEPLHAVYAKQCESAIRRAIERGERSIRSFFHDVRVRKVTEEEIRRFADPKKAFFNVNFRGDVEQCGKNNIF